ncbi:MAG: ABC transporter ATP-binding protein, partial [Betaproteobacteria bacterium]
MNLLEVRDLAVRFRIDETTTLDAVKGISFDVPVRSTVALVGESGSGKSVTALSVMGLLPKENASVSPSSRILYRGRELLTVGSSEMQKLRGAEIAMIFQEPMSSLNPVFTVGFQIGEVLRKHLGISGRALRDRAVELLSEVGIPEPQNRLEAYPFQLSGGQQQRVMIAMAIACEPKLLIADEPTTALDVTVQRQIMDLIAGLQERHEMAMLFITHDLALVSEIADHVVVMRDGEIREQAAASQLFRDPRDAYTRALLACRPPRERRPQRLPVIDDFLTGKGPPGGERRRGLTGGEPALLEARGLAKSFYFREGFFRSRELKAVKGASFRIAKGKTLGVVGESGSGKTTVALLVARLHQATGGEVRFEGRDLLAIDAREAMPYKRRIQIVFQNPYASLNPRFTVAQILTEPLLIHGIGADDGERRAMAGELLRKVGLPPESLEKYPHEFSGGQRQRIAIARALTLRPELLICDESVSALDVSVQAQLLNLLQDLQDEYAMSYLFISHDLAVVRYMADEV